jgi:hypothetical protein
VVAPARATPAWRSGRPGTRAEGEGEVAGKPGGRPGEAGLELDRREQIRGDPGLAAAHEPCDLRVGGGALAGPDQRGGEPAQRHAAGQDRHDQADRARRHRERGQRRHEQEQQEGRDRGQRAHPEGLPAQSVAHRRQESAYR